MTKIRKNEIAELIINYGFELKDFTFQPISSSYFNLTYLKDTNYKFTTDSYGNVTYSPGPNGEAYFYDNEVNNFTGYNQSSWQTRLIFTQHWLEAINENIAISDPWDQFENFESERVNIGDNSSAPLSDDEINFVNEKLDIILEALREFATDFTRIKEDLDYLKSAGNSMSKKDWGTMVMGNVMGWAISNAIHKDSLHDVWNIIIQNLGNQNLIT